MVNLSLLHLIQDFEIERLGDGSATPAANSGCDANARRITTKSWKGNDLGASHRGFRGKNYKFGSTSATATSHVP